MGGVVTLFYRASGEAQALVLTCRQRYRQREVVALDRAAAYGAYLAGELTVGGVVTAGRDLPLKGKRSSVADSWSLLKTM